MYDIYVAALNSLWVLIIVPVMFVIVYFLLKKYAKVCKDLSRLQSVNGSPVLSHLAETLNGASTIRAFTQPAAPDEQQDNPSTVKKVQLFINKNYGYLNQKMNMAFWLEACERWFSIRTLFASIMIFVFTSLF
mmetsp:Transcript_42723/g.50043  ORF Transcript_42723/g.50043 Transcript_42723/m.50043 type:complete len:133 (-) Transcript_42723:376-774(-)